MWKWPNSSSGSRANFFPSSTKPSMPSRSSFHSSISCSACSPTCSITPQPPSPSVTTQGVAGDGPQPYLTEGHGGLAGQEQRRQVRLHLVLLLGVLADLAGQAALLQHRLGVAGVIHAQDVIPVLELGLEDLNREAGDGPRITTPSRARSTPSRGLSPGLPPRSQACRCRTWHSVPSRLRVTMACLGRCSIPHSSWLSFSAAARTSRGDFLPIQMKTSDQQSRMYTLWVSSRLCSCEHGGDTGQASLAGKSPACSQKTTRKGRASPMLAKPAPPRAELEAEGTQNQLYWSKWECGAVERTWGYWWMKDGT